MSQDYPSDWSTRSKEVYERDNYTCQNCGREGGPTSNLELHAHHIVPKSKGGTHSKSNLQTLCKDCHKAIHDDTKAPSANPKKTKTTGQEEYSIHPFSNLEPFEKCPICRDKGSFEVLSDGVEIKSAQMVARCTNCRTELSTIEMSSFLYGQWIEITNSSYNIEGYKFLPMILKKIEKQGFDDLSELERYEQEGHKFLSNLRQTYAATTIISIVSVIIGVVLGKFLLSIAVVTATIIGGFVIIKHLQKRVKS